MPIHFSWCCANPKINVVEALKVSEFIYANSTSHKSELDVPESQK